MEDKEAADTYLTAARRALGEFPVAVRCIRTAAISENVSFRVTTADGSDFVLRLHRPGYNSLRELESEGLWRDALAEARLEVQCALTARDGRRFIPVTIETTGEQRYASLVSWLPGQVLGGGPLAVAGAAERQAIFRDLGRFAARIHNQAAGWQEPPGFERPRLDSDGLLGEQPRWGRFWEHGALTQAERSLLLAARERLRAMLESYGANAENFSLIHADLHPGNVLIDPQGRLGVIDFDDSAYGWHGYDLASALIEEHGAGDFGELRGALLAGYREFRTLPARDEAMLPRFMLLRGMALIGWVHERPEHAGDEYFEGIRAMVLARSRNLLDEP